MILRFVLNTGIYASTATPVVSKTTRQYGYDLIATAANDWAEVVPILAEDEATNGAIHQSKPALLIAKPNEMMG